MPVRRVDLDELLDDPLVLVIGGRELTVKGLSVEDAMRLARAGQDATGGDALGALAEMLVPLGLTTEEANALDCRKALAAAAIIVSHFTSLPRKVMALTSAAMQATVESLSDGQPPSPATSPPLDVDQQ